MIWKRIVVRETERALVFVRGRLEAVLTPGVHRVLTWRRDVEVEVHGTLDPVVVSAFTAVLLQMEAAATDAHFLRVQVAEGQAAMIFADGVLLRVLGPGEKVLVWKAPKTITVRMFDTVAEPAIESALVPALIRLGAAVARVQLVTVGKI